MLQTNNLVADHTYPIGISFMEPQDDCVLHRHDNLELAIITGGSGSHRAQRGSYPLERGDVFVIPVDMAHGYERTRNLTLINVVFDQKRVELPARRLADLPGYDALFALEPRLRKHQAFGGHLHLEEDDLTWLIATVRQLQQELADHAPGWEQSAHAWLLQIIIRLSRLYADHQAPAAQQVMRLESILAHIDQHLDKNLDIEQLCAVGKISKSTLQRGFKALFGASVNQHIIHSRMKVARELLANAELPIGEIAKRVGIRDANYFSRLFTKSVGRSPRAFRQSAG